MAQAERPDGSRRLVSIVKRGEPLAAVTGLLCPLAAGASASRRPAASNRTRRRAAEERSVNSGTPAFGWDGRDAHRAPPRSLWRPVDEHGHSSSDVVDIVAVSVPR